MNETKYYLVTKDHYFGIRYNERFIYKHTVVKIHIKNSAYTMFSKDMTWDFASAKDNVLNDDRLVEITLAQYKTICDIDRSLEHALSLIDVANIESGNQELEDVTDLADIIYDKIRKYRNEVVQKILLTRDS